MDSNTTDPVMIPENGVLTPELWAIAERVNEPVTGNEPRHEPNRFDTPSANISWVASNLLEPFTTRPPFADEDSKDLAMATDSNRLNKATETNPGLRSSNT
jgi:hypothetical protein